MTVLPVAEFAPDMPDLADATNIAVNVIARTTDSYGPVNALAPSLSGALPSACVGLFGCKNRDETTYIFSGTMAALYTIGLSFTWENVSKAGGYSVLVGESWKFAQFGSRVVATDFADPIQSIIMGVQTEFSDLSADAPKARFLAVAKTFLIAANTYDSVGGPNPARIWWSGSNDPSSWPIPGSALAQQQQSDYSDLNGPLGDITGLVPNLAGCDCAVFFEQGVQRMIYVGPPDIFDFYPAQNVNGTRASNSIVAFGSLVYYLADNGFYAFDGNTSAPIGESKVDKWFFENVNQTYLYNVIGGVDVVSKAILWLFPSTSSVDGMPDTILIYRWPIQRWSYAAISAQWIARLLSLGISMDNMDQLGYTDVDTLPYSLDSRFWLGGVPSLGAVDPSGYLSYFDGDTLEAQIGTKSMQIVPNGLAFVRGSRPLVDGGSPTIAMSTRDTYTAAEVWGADVAPNSMGDCPQRSVGRYHRARVTVPAGTTWTQMAGVDLDAIPAGKR
jgi:hypothetical protein